MAVVGRPDDPVDIRPAAVPAAGPTGACRTIVRWALGALLLASGTVHAQPDAAAAAWGTFLQDMQLAAETYMREATRGSDDVLVAQSGYLQADRYYSYARQLAPDTPQLQAAQRVVQDQLARFQRQHRWELLRTGVVGSVWGSPLARRLHDGTGLGLGRVWYDLDAAAGVVTDAIPESHWALRHSRRRLPFLFQLQAGMAYDQTTLDNPARIWFATEHTDRLAGHASAELDYTILPLLSYLLPYAGVGYLGMAGTFDDGSKAGDYYLHGSYWRLGAVLSLGRTLKLTADLSRSLSVYGSHFSPSGAQRLAGVRGRDDCFDGWSATQLTLEFVF